MPWVIKTRGASNAPIVSDYLCGDCGYFEAIVERPAPDLMPCPDCGKAAEWTISAVRIKHPTFISCHRGKSDPAPYAEALDTEALADGKITYNEFRKKRRAMWEASDADADPDRPKKVYSI